MGPFRKITRRFFETGEFQIDEKPFAVHAASPAAPAVHGTNGNGVQAPGEQQAKPIAPDVPDVLSSLREILAEKNRLTEKLAEEIQPAGPKEDEFAQYAREAPAFIDAIESILHLARTNDLPEEIAGWLESVDSAYTKKLKPALEKHDFIIMDCVGQEVDFDIHDVIEYRRTKDHPHNTVIEERRKGILFRGRIMRDAKVVVACNE